MNENKSPIITGVTHGVTIAFIAYGAYSLAKLGYEWAKIGFVAIKDRKNINI
jgi:hypothetical protein